MEVAYTKWLAFVMMTILRTNKPLKKLRIRIVKFNMEIIYKYFSQFCKAFHTLTIAHMTMMQYVDVHIYDKFNVTETYASRHYAQNWIFSFTTVMYFIIPDNLGKGKATPVTGREGP
jgi:hypothetical protein